MLCNCRLCFVCCSLSWSSSFAVSVVFALSDGRAMIFLAPVNDIGLSHD